MVTTVQQALREFDDNTHKGNVVLIRVLESKKTAFVKAVDEDGTIDDIRDSLENWLMAQQSIPNNINTYEIQYIKNYKKTRQGVQPTEMVATKLIFNPNSYMPGQVGNIPTPGNNDAVTLELMKEVREMRQQLAEQNNVIASMLAAKEAESEEEETEEPEKTKGLGAIFENEQFQNLMIAGLSMFVQNMMNKNQAQNNEQAPAPQISGTELSEEDKKAIEAIELLKKRDAKYGSHLLYLAKVNSVTYNMLLSFIK